MLSRSIESPQVTPLEVGAWPKRIVDELLATVAELNGFDLGKLTDAELLLFTIASRLGRTVRDLGESLPLSELLGWQAFLEWEANQDSGRLDAAEMAHALTSISSTQKGGPS